MFTLIIGDLEFYIYESEFDDCWKFYSNADGIENHSKTIAGLMNEVNREVSFWIDELAPYHASPMDVFSGPNQWPLQTEWIDDGF